MLNLHCDCIFGVLFVLRSEISFYIRVYDTTMFIVIRVYHEFIHAWLHCTKLICQYRPNAIMYIVQGDHRRTVPSIKPAPDN
jgi:hypothetical protein